MTLDFTKTIANWRNLVRPRASELAETRAQLHWAAQLVAALGATLTPARDDLSHTSLVWSHSEDGLFSHASATEPSVRALLHFPEPRIDLFREQGGGTDKRVASIALEGLSFAEAQAALEASVAEQIGRMVRLERPRHELPEHPLDPAGEGAAFGGWSQLALDELTRWYANGALALAELRSHDARAGEVLCWPHHFDIATLIAVERERPDEPTSPVVRSVGVGMTPGDGSYADAYWYVNCWPLPSPETKLPALAGGGIWHREGWVGGVLTATALRDPQAEKFAAFMGSAIAACERLIEVHDE